MVKFNIRKRILSEEEELNLKKVLEEQRLAGWLKDMDCFKDMGSYVLPVHFHKMASPLHVFEVQGLLIHYIEFFTNRRFYSSHLDESNKVLLLVFC